VLGLGTILWFTLSPFLTDEQENLVGWLRVIHISRRGYSAQDQPGSRYDVFSIDYGAYVDLINTQAAPAGNLPTDEDGGYVEVPTPDLRTVRRAILHLQDFDSRGGDASGDANESSTPLPGL
jgi:hypothetical protein